MKKVPSEPYSHKLEHFRLVAQEDTQDMDSIIPVNIVTLSSWTFAREYRALRRTFRFGEFKNTWISGPFGQIDKFLET